MVIVLLKVVSEGKIRKFVQRCPAENIALYSARNYENRQIRAKGPAQHTYTRNLLNNSIGIIFKLWCPYLILISLIADLPRCRISPISLEFDHIRPATPENNFLICLKYLKLTLYWIYINVENMLSLVNVNIFLQDGKTFGKVLGTQFLR